MRDHSYCCPLLLLVWGEGPYEEEEEDEGEEKEGKLLLRLKEEVLVLIH